MRVKPRLNVAFFVLGAAGGKQQMAGGASSAATLGLPTHLSDPAWSAAAERRGKQLALRSCLLRFAQAARPEESFATHGGKISLFISVLISLPLTFQTHMIHD